MNLTDLIPPKLFAMKAVATINRVKLPINEMSMLQVMPYLNEVISQLHPTDKKKVDDIAFVMSILQVLQDCLNETKFN